MDVPDEAAVGDPRASVGLPARREHSSGPSLGLHGDRIPADDLLMAQTRVTVVRDSFLEPVKVDVNEKGIPIRSDTGKGSGKQLRQRRPVRSPFADHRSNKRQPQR